MRGKKGEEFSRDINSIWKYMSNSFKKYSTGAKFEEKNACYDYDHDLQSFGMFL